MESGICDTWEEEMYWKNFHFSHFFRVLPSDFHHRLMLPKKFTDNMRTQLPDKIVLKVHGTTWNVRLEKDKDDVMLQGDGWQDFAKAYSLKKSDMLFFKYNRHECFEVLLFDQANLCEKEASYFVRKSLQPNSDDRDDSSGEVKENSAQEFTDRNQEGFDDSAYNFRSRRRNSDVYDEDERDETSDEEDERDETSDEENSSSDEECTTPRKADAKRFRQVKRNYKVVEKATRKRKRSFVVACYKSNRRPVTEEEKAKALKKARETAAQYLDSFIVIMRPSSVYKRFHMSIPKEWKLRSIKKDNEMILKVKDKTWVCTVSFTRYTRGFEGGWKRFARENFLEEFDVCLFVPTGSKDGRTILDVSIFRVVPEFVLPSPVTTFNAEVQEISSDDRSQGDDDTDYTQRNRLTKCSGVTPKGHSSGRDARNRVLHEDEWDESSDEEKSNTEEDSSPVKAAAAREVPSNSSRKFRTTASKENGGYGKSSSRQITETDKEQVLKKAKETATKHQNSFIAVMRPSCVDKRYFVSIPKDWKPRHEMRKGQEVVLKVTEKTWVCTFCSSPSNVGLQSGWKRFALENKLEEFDVCVFVPAEWKNEKLVFDVIISRVRPDGV